MSNEDYLEAIVDLGGTTTEPVRSVDVAEKLGVSKASVSKAMSNLRDDGLVDQEPYGGVKLTPDGLAYGTKVLQRHRLLFAFLTQELGVPPETANDEACRMEHAISDESFKRWIAYGARIGLRLTGMPQYRR